MADSPVTETQQAHSRAPEAAAAGDATAGYSPDTPYGVKGEWIRHDLLALAEQPRASATPWRVLSLGCGTGATETRLQEQGAEVWGLDVSADAVEIAKQRLTRAMVADIETEDLPELRPASFGLVLAGDVLEHLRFTEHALRRIHGWLEPDGHFVVGIPNATHYSVIKTLALQRDWKYEDGGLFDRGHYRLFTKKSLLRLLAAHGFAIEVVRGTHALSGKMKVVRALLAPLRWMFRGLDEYFVYTWTVRARKVTPPAGK